MASGVTDCSCDVDEVVISGGGWTGTTIGIFINESGPANERTWRIGCRNSGEQVVCGGMKVVCAKFPPR